MTWQFSSIRLRMYSLFQKYRARSATWDRIKRENEKEYTNRCIHHLRVFTSTTGRRVGGMLQRERGSWPGNEGWRCRQRSVWIEAPAHGRTEMVQSRPESPRSPPGTSPEFMRQDYTPYKRSNIYFQVHLWAENIRKTRLDTCLDSSAVINSNDTTLFCKCSFRHIHGWKNMVWDRDSQMGVL